MEPASVARGTNSCPWQLEHTTVTFSGSTAATGAAEAAGASAAASEMFAAADSCSDTGNGGIAGADLPADDKRAREDLLSPRGFAELCLPAPAAEAGAAAAAGFADGSSATDAKLGVTDAGAATGPAVAAVTLDARRNSASSTASRGCAPPRTNWDASASTTDDAAARGERPTRPLPRGGDPGSRKPCRGASPESPLSETVLVRDALDCE